MRKSREVRKWLPGVGCPQPTTPEKPANAGSDEEFLIHLDTL